MLAAQVRREALLSGLAAAAIAAFLIAVGPTGVDLAAHEYGRTLFLHAGFVVWNNFWYAGSYSFVGYSLLYYPLAALTGTTLLAIASVGAAACAFALVVVREWGGSARLASWVFAVLWAGIVLSAAFPFALGVALALFAVAALQSGRTWRFAALAFLSLAASPLAFLLLVVIVAGAALGQRPDRSRMLAPALVLSAASAAQVVTMRLFPRGGSFPFTLWELVPALLFCGVGFVFARNVPHARALGGVFVVYSIVCVLAFAIPSQLGSNVERLRYAALPLLLLTLSLRGWRPLRYVLPVIALTAVWNLAPVATSAARSSADTNVRYWAPAIGFLHAHLSPSYRVEVVDTVDHWAAESLPAAGIPIVRGWYRQSDFPQNQLLYEDEPIGASAYRAWLLRFGVRYVVLADAPSDYSARGEARLLRSGRSGLQIVFRGRHLTVFSVPGARPIVTGPAPAHVVSVTATRLAFVVAAPGTYRVAIRWSPYLTLRRGCLAPARDGTTLVTTAAAGTLRLDFRLSVERGLETLAGASPSRTCSR
ncbi:MAG: hypothetical protein ACYDA3_11295 [Gaiellaceae bacterium]